VNRRPTRVAFDGLLEQDGWIDLREPSVKAYDWAQAISSSCCALRLPGFPASIKLALDWLPEVARYSFTAARIFLDARPEGRRRGLASPSTAA
jgi:hypothetical protein